MWLRCFQAAQLSDGLCDPGEQGTKWRKIGKGAVTGEHVSTDNSIWGSYCTGTSTGDALWVPVEPCIQRGACGRLHLSSPDSDGVTYLWSLSFGVALEVEYFSLQCRGSWFLLIHKSTAWPCVYLYLMQTSTCMDSDPHLWCV